MRMEVGVKENSKKKLVRSTWAGHMEKKLGDEKLAKRADAQKVEGKWRPGRRPTLQWALH